jgi:abortive infection alpha-like protein
VSEEDRDVEAGPEGSDALQGMARLAATAGWRTSAWTVRSSLRASRRMMRAAVSPGEAVSLARDFAHVASVIARDLSELTGVQPPGGPAGAAADVAQKVADAVPMSFSADGRSDGNAHPQRSLREEGELLLERSRDVRYEFDMHPAYERILTELAPDEARIVRLLLVEGPQPSVDVRTGGPLGMVRSRLVASGLSMIGARAGCRYVERVPSYLNNLFRLGLIWFSRETLRESRRYQVLEAQPDVLEAIHSVGQAKVVRRSIHLTPFGEDFCRIALCPEEASDDGLPPHSAPEATHAAEALGDEEES